MIEALINVIQIPVEFDDIAGGAKGYYSPGEHRIAIKAGMAADQTAKTLVHEFTHSLLHNVDSDNKGKTRGQIEAEAEAEGTAFVVASYFGLDTSNYSFGYVAGWASQDGGTELVRSIGTTIQRTAHQVIAALEAYLHPDSKASA